MAKSDDLDIVKKAHSKSDYSDTGRVNELVRCVDDPLYFMKSFMKIQHPMKGAIKFDPYPFQLEIIKAFHENRFTIALTARQMGKALGLVTPVLTPLGFKNVGSLEVGDTIYGQDGKPTQITFITETMHDRPCFEIEFMHGEKIIADADHLWTINIPGYKKPRKETVTTSRMIELVDYYRSTNGGQSISIDHCETIQFDEQDTSLDPYLLGVWLGDGTIWSSKVGCHKDDYPHYRRMAENRGHDVGELKLATESSGVFSLGSLFSAQLSAACLKRTKKYRERVKHIPTEFIYNSVEKRLNLLQGLMDTDGCVEKNGVCRFYQSDKEFAEQVRFLLSTLGIKSTLRVKKTTHKDCYILTFTTDQMVCTLPRKAERLANIKHHPKNKRIYIRSITPVDSVPVRCLQVDNEDHLFLAGKTLVPTHNTTVAAGYLLWKAMFTPDTTILVTANKLVQALEIMDRIRFAYENLPNHIRAGVTEYNKGTIAFDNGSKIVARATSSDAGRGLSITLLYLDEFAFVPPNKAKDFWTSIQPVLSTGGACIITSTPKSDEDQFAQIWKGAIDNVDKYGNPRRDNLGRNGFFAIKVPWSAHPERDEKWAEPFRESLGEARFRQEFECDFVTDDETLINPMLLSRLEGIQPEFYTGQVRWFKDPEPNKTYLVGLDPCLGTGGDYSAIQIFELPEMIQVGEWEHNETAPRGQVRVLMQILMFLDDALRGDKTQIGDPDIFWTVENNTLGEAILQIIEDTGEERFPGTFVSEKKRKGQVRRFRKGLNTDNKKKLSACARVKSLIETDRMILCSNQLIKQFKSFVHTESSFKAKPGEHDDLVMSALLCVRMLDTVLQYAHDTGDLREHIADDELFSSDDYEAMPVIV